jgi:hypothetical protein
MKPRQHWNSKITDPVFVYMMLFTFDKLYHTMLYQTEILLKVALNTIPPNNLVETNLRYRTTFYDKLFFLGVHPKPRQHWNSKITDPVFVYMMLFTFVLLFKSYRPCSHIYICSDWLLFWVLESFMTERPNLLSIVVLEWLVYGVWCFTPLSTIFQLYRGGQFYWRGNRSTQRKPQTCRKSPTNYFNLFFFFFLFFANHYTNYWNAPLLLI